MSASDEADGAVGVMMRVAEAAAAVDDDGDGTAAPGDANGAARVENVELRRTEAQDSDAGHSHAKEGPPRRGAGVAARTADNLDDVKRQNGVTFRVIDTTDSWCTTPPCNDR